MNELACVLLALTADQAELSNQLPAGVSPEAHRSGQPPQPLPEIPASARCSADAGTTGSPLVQSPRRPPILPRTDHAAIESARGGWAARSPSALGRARASMYASEFPLRRRISVMDGTIRVLLADVHPLVRAGIRTTLSAETDLDLVGEAVKGDEARKMCSELEPDVLLLDVQIPGPPAAQTVSFLRTHCPEVRTVILAAHNGDEYVRELISAGAVGYVLKDEAPRALVRAIHTVMQGDTWFSRTVLEKLARADVDDGPTQAPALTERERQVLRLVVKGDTNKQIGKTLGISAKAVEKHLSGVFAKLGVPSRSAAAAWAVSQGLG